MARILLINSAGNNVRPIATDGDRHAAVVCDNDGTIEAEDGDTGRGTLIDSSAT